MHSILNRFKMSAQYHSEFLPLTRRFHQGDFSRGNRDTSDGEPLTESLLDSLEVDHTLKLAISLPRAYLIAMKL
jgi:hypothetical protein